MGLTGLLPRWFGRLVAALPDPATVIAAIAVAVVAVVLLRALYRRLVAGGS